MDDSANDCKLLPWFVFVNRHPLPLVILTAWSEGHRQASEDIIAMIGGKKLKALP